MNCLNCGSQTCSGCYGELPTLEPLGEPFQTILNENRWNLYEGEIQHADITDSDRVNFLSNTIWLFDYRKNHNEPVKYRMIKQRQPWGKWHLTLRGAVDAAILSERDIGRQSD